LIQRIEILMIARIGQFIDTDRGGGR